MFNIKLEVIRYKKGQESMINNREGNYLIKIKLEILEMMELEYKEFEMVVINMYKDFKLNINIIKEKIVNSNRKV